MKKTVYHRNQDGYVVDGRRKIENGHELLHFFAGRPNSIVENDQTEQGAKHHHASGDSLEPGRGKFSDQNIDPHMHPGLETMRNSQTKVSRDTSSAQAME